MGRKAQNRPWQGDWQSEYLGTVYVITQIAVAHELWMFDIPFCFEELEPCLHSRTIHIPPSSPTSP